MELSGAASSSSAQASLVESSEATGRARAPRPVGRPVIDKPLVDPPEIDADGRIRDTDELPHWVPGAFPTIFQNETGDPYNFTLAKPDLLTWGPHILRSKGWRAQAHMTFMSLWMNTCQRIKALSARKWFVKDNPYATGYTADAIKGMSVPMFWQRIWLATRRTYRGPERVNIGCGNHPDDGAAD